VTRLRRPQPVFLLHPLRPRLLRLSLLRLRQ
jgi:hypothetical protein